MRLNDSGFAGAINICDFISYEKPHIYLLELKTTAGQRLPLANISTGQYSGLLDADKYNGIIGGILIWWYDMNVTKFLSITEVETIKTTGKKSIRFDTELGIKLEGTKKKVYFEYDFNKFFLDAKSKYGS